jgi:hypothetical protein
VLEDAPKRKPSVNITREAAVTSVVKGPKSPEEAMLEQQELLPKPCHHCGSLVETQYAFCWNCGQSMEPNKMASVTHLEKPLAVIRPAAIATEDEEPTLPRQAGPAGPEIFAWVSPEEPNRPFGSSGTAPKLIAIALGGLLVSFAVFVLLRWVPRADSKSSTQAIAQDAKVTPDAAPSPEAERNLITEPARPQTPVAHPEDVELRKLRETQNSAQPSDRPAIVEAFTKAENKYPNDYRFAYERAKLSIKADQSHSHQETFSALSLAAEKAIKTGKAEEMLNRLEADRDGDFHKLSHGHSEWSQLEAALKRKDMATLKAKYATGI